MTPNHTVGGDSNRLILDKLKADNLQEWVSAFLLDCKTRNLSPRTVEFYRERLGGILAFQFWRVTCTKIMPTCKTPTNAASLLMG